MFESKLKETFQRIFDVKKVSFDQPGESQEQECLFIEISTSKNAIKDGLALAMVEGNCIMFANGEKLPFGFFSKRIRQADLADTKDLFFFDIEGNTKRYGNIVQRGFSFVYFFRGQYDPETGSITSIEFMEDSE